MTALPPAGQPPAGPGLAPTGESPPPAPARVLPGRLRADPGLLLKRLVLLFGGLYFAMVAVTNAVNFIATVGGFSERFLNSGNVAYIASVTKVYSWPGWTDDAVVLPAALAQGVGPLLFGGALPRLTGGGAG